MSTQVYVSSILTPWTILYITVYSGFIKQFTYVIQSSSIKMLGFYCEIFVILKYCMKIFLTWLFSIYTKRCYYCVPEGESCHRSFITYQAWSCKEFRISFSPAVPTYLISQHSLELLASSFLQVLTPSENYFSIKVKAQSWNVNNISLKLASVVKIKVGFTPFSLLQFSPDNVGPVIFLAHSLQTFHSSVYCYFIWHCWWGMLLQNFQLDFSPFR